MNENTAEFVPFARAPFWDTQATNPASAPCADLAARYAQVVLAYWRDCQQDSPEPLYIIALAANGAFTYSFLLSLFDPFESIATGQERLVYVFTHTDPAVLDAAAQHEKLQPFCRQGRLDFALFDPAAPGPLHLTLSHQSLIPHKLAYPPVLIANGVLSSLRQDLFVVEHQQLYEAWASPAADDANALVYQQRPLSGGYLDCVHADLLEHYRQRLPNCALLFPFQALQLLKYVYCLHGQELLLLCADQCLHQELELTRQREFQPGATLTTPPLNAHALDRIIIAQGGKVWHSLSDGSDSTSILAALMGSQQLRPQTQRAMHQYLGRLNPMDTQTLRASFANDAEYLSLEVMLALLRSHNWDDKLFKSFFPYLTLSGLSKNQQDHWRIALARIWANHFPTQDAQEDLAFDLASLAAQMHRWRYAIDLFSQSLTFKGPQSVTYANIGIAHWQMGNLTQAEKSLRTALPLWQAEQQEDNLRAEAEHPDTHTIEQQANPIQTQLDALNLWQNKVRSLLGPNPLLRAPGEANNPSAIGLTLLGSHQAEALYLQQRHSSLARQVGVRTLNSVRDAERWIEQESAANKTPLAIMHPQYGLIGLAVLETATALLNATHNLARFYYWITPAQQNQGFGSQALALLQSFAQGYGIKYLFSAVHRANLKSQRAMAKTGYQRLNFAFEPGSADDSGVDFYLNVIRPGAAASEFERYQAFAAFIQTFSEPITLAPFAGAEEIEVTRLKLPEPASTEEAH